MKKSEHNYITKFFENNLKNLKNTWKHIKSIIFMKSLSSYSPSLLTYESETIDNPKRISNIFNNYFSTIGAKIPEKRKHLHKNYSDYLTNENRNSFFLSLTNKEEIGFIISSLDINKSNGPYSIPNKVLKLLKKDISEQFAISLNLSFTIGIQPNISKTSKVILSQKIF